MNASGKVSFATRKLNATFGRRCGRRPSATGSLPAYKVWVPSFIASSCRGTEANKTRGFEIDQRNFTGNADVTLDEHRQFLSLKAGCSPGQLPGYRPVPDITPWSLSRSTSTLGPARAARQYQGGEF
jgi:hypothetical protein